MARSSHRRSRGAPLAALLTVALTSTFLASPAGAANSSPDPTPLELANGALSRTAATQGMVLLENYHKALPLPKSGNVALFGVGASYTVTGGTGSGQVNNRHTVSVLEGFKSAGYTVTTNDSYLNAVTAAYDAKYGNIGNLVIKPAIDYASLEQSLTADTVRPKAPTDTAIYVLARNSGEAADRKSGPGDYLLTDVERADIKLIGQNFKRVVVVLNSGGIVDTHFVRELNGETTDPTGKYPIDALLLMSQAGQESGSALVDVLRGKVTPSGKLTDTWTSAYKYYPAAATLGANDGDALHEQYSEGIYVGYRYFDSFYKKINPANPKSVVLYPFGFGRSYTTFRVTPTHVSADMKTVQVKAKVTNTGKKYSGKQVVQVYFSAPAGRLDQPYQALASYAKTDNLAPGKSQTLTIKFKTTEMASFDEATASYVMGAGDYLIRVGDSSRNTRVAAKLHLAKRTVTERLSHQLNDAKPATELRSSRADFYSYSGQAREIRKAKRIQLSTRHFKAANNASPVDQNVTVGTSSPLYAIDGAKISSVPVYLDKDDNNWDGTGAAYKLKDGETVRYVDTNPAFTLYDVKAGRATMEQFVAGLNLTQLADIVEGSAKAGSTLSAVGAAGYTTPLYESLGIPGMTLADGPAGVRINPVVGTTTKTYQYCTAWPIGTLLAQTWDSGVIAKVANGLGDELAAFGVTLWLAPGMNIHRDPLNGRNFEYFSEDPFLTGMTAIDLTRGVQKAPGVGVTIKHFIANNQEAERSFTDATISERAVREIYLKGFELAVKGAQPMAVMTSYNKINGTYAAGSYDLDEDILRGEWGFRGLVMSDWGAVPRAGLANTMYAGNDLVEPGNTPAEVFNAFKQMAPSIDISGLPVYNQTRSILTLAFRWTWTLGSLTLSSTGSETFTKTVDATTDLSKAPASMITTVDSINNATYQQHPPFASVDAAYREVMSYLDPSSAALTTAQKAAITVSNVQHQNAADPASPVVAYKVTIKGTYPPLGYPLRLGDLQRSATRILNVAMQSAPFGQLAQLQGVAGVQVGSYNAQFRKLPSYLDTSKSRVRRG